MLESYKLKFTFTEDEDEILNELEQDYPELSVAFSKYGRYSEKYNDILKENQIDYSNSIGNIQNTVFIGICSQFLNLKGSLA